MYKKITCLFLSVLAAILLCACDGRLPEGVDKTELETHSHQVIDAVNAKDYEKLVSLYSPAGPALEEWPAMLEPYTNTFGEFKEYKQFTYVTVKDETHGEVVVGILEADYENITQVWRITFKPNYEVVGLWITKAVEEKDA